MERFSIRVMALVLAELVVAVCAIPAVGADSKALKAAFEKMLKPALVESETYRVDSLTINQRDLVLRLSDGYLIFLEPLLVDSTAKTYGALFIDDPVTPGEALFQFNPSLAMEREQIRRFLKTDSLNRKCPSALLLFNQSMGDQLKAGLAKATIPKRKETPDMVLKDRFAPLVIKEDMQVPFAAFKNVVAPRSKPFLAVSVPGDHAGDLVYMFDPYEREEVSLFKKYGKFSWTLGWKPSANTRSMRIPPMND